MIFIHSVHYTAFCSKLAVFLSVPFHAFYFSLLSMSTYSITDLHPAVFSNVCFFKSGLCYLFLVIISVISMSFLAIYSLTELYYSFLLTVFS